MVDQLKPPLADRVAAAMAEQTAWSAADREERRRQPRQQDHRDWQEVAARIAQQRRDRAVIR